MGELDLVREVDAYEQTLSIDVFFWRGSAGDPAGWKVRVRGYDGRSSMPSIFALLPGGEDEAATEPLWREVVGRYRGEGWSEELPEDARARIDAREEREQAAEQARVDDLARREAAFPVTEADRWIAKAIRKPTGVSELDVRVEEGDRVTVLPRAIKKLTALRVLRVSGHGLPELPEELFACKALRELHLAGNRIEEVPAAIWSLKELEILDLTDNRLQRFYARPKVPIRLELAGNPLAPAEQTGLTRAAIGDLRKVTHLSVDTDCLFPVDLAYLAVEYPKVKALPLSSLVLHGRAPTTDERATLAKVFPKAEIASA